MKLFEKKSGGDEEYEKFFQKALKKFGVKEPDELSGDKEKEFYNYIDKNWESDKEEKKEMKENLKEQVQTTVRRQLKDEINKNKLDEGVAGWSGYFCHRSGIQDL